MERELSILLKARDQASKVIQGVGDQADKTGKSIKDTLTANIGALGGAFAATTGIIVSSIAAYAESENATAQLNAVIKSTGGAAGVTADQVLALSSALQQQSTFGDEALTNAQSLLLTFTSIGKDVFPEATKTIVDMSTALGQDLKASAIQLGKALNDPIQGVTALKRVGVSFNEEQLKQIETMQKSGDLMGAQKLILAELGKEFGGSALAQSQTFTGQMTVLKNNIGDLQETIGMGLLTALMEMTGGFDNLNKQILGVNAFLIEHKDILMAAVVAIGFVAVGLGVLLIAAMVAVAGTSGLVILALTALVAAFAFVAAMAYQHWNEIVAYTQNLYNQVSTTFTQLVAFLGGILKHLETIIFSSMNLHVFIITGALQLIRATWEGGWKGFYETIVNWLNRGIKFITDGINTIKNMFTALATSIENIFRGIRIPSFHIDTETKDIMGTKVQVPKVGWYENGGYVPETMLAVIHKGEFVLSKDMLAGNAPAPAIAGGGSIQIGPVYVQDQGDIETLSQRLSFLMKTRGR